MNGEEEKVTKVHYVCLGSKSLIPYYKRLHEEESMGLYIFCGENLKSIDFAY